MTAVLVAGAAVCDRSCYDAGGPDCTCVCGGANHGVGRALAVEHAPALAAAGRGRVALLELPLGPFGGVDAAPVVELERGLPAASRRRPELRCAGCGRPESEAPAAYLVDRGRFCFDCSEEARRWP